LKEIRVLFPKEDRLASGVQRALAEGSQNSVMKPMAKVRAGCPAHTPALNGIWMEISFSPCNDRGSKILNVL
jgi:hypothetical protein